jgi:hypothetical protein
MSTEGVKLSGACQPSRTIYGHYSGESPYGRRRCTDVIRSLSLRQKDRAKLKYKIYLRHPNDAYYVFNLIISYLQSLAKIGFFI